MSFENAEFCVAHLRSRSGLLRLGSWAPLVARFGFGGASGGSGTDPRGRCGTSARRSCPWSASFGFQGVLWGAGTGPTACCCSARGRGAEIRRVRLGGRLPVRLEGGLPVRMAGELWGEDWQAEQLRAAERKQAGNDLFNYLIAMYAGSRPMTAKDACIISWFAKEAGCEGGVCDLALHPKNTGGTYQRKIDSAIPRKPDSEYYWLDLPIYQKGVGRTTKRIPMLPLHESLQHECGTTPSLAPESLTNNAEFQEWQQIYSWHPGVRACKPDVPLLLSLYADGIRFTRSERTGKADSLLGFFMHLIPQSRRHSVAFLRKSEFCKCGCRGWCSHYPIMLVIAWSMRALIQGRYPSAMHDGSPFVTGGPREDLAGTPLRKGVVVWMKGDLMEQAVTFGLRGLGSMFSPCFICNSLLENLHDYDTVELDSDHWGQKSDLNDYEVSCQRLEHVVVLHTEADRFKATPTRKRGRARWPPRAHARATERARRRGFDGMAGGNVLGGCPPRSRRRVGVRRGFF